MQAAENASPDPMCTYISSVCTGRIIDGTSFAVRTRVSHSIISVVSKLLYICMNDLTGQGDDFGILQCSLLSAVLACI